MNYRSTVKKSTFQGLQYSVPVLIEYYSTVQKYRWLFVVNIIIFRKKILGKYSIRRTDVDLAPMTNWKNNFSNK